MVGASNRVPKVTACHHWGAHQRTLCLRILALFVSTVVMSMGGLIFEGIDFVRMTNWQLGGVTCVLNRSVSPRPGRRGNQCQLAAS